MCFCVFGMSETYNPANGFTSVAVPCGRQWLVLARLALCSWETYRLLAPGALLWTQRTLSLMPVHPTLWKASSRSQCSRNLIQTQSFFCKISLQLCLPRGVSGGDAEPQCSREREGRWREEGEGSTLIALISVSGICSRAETTELGYDCALGGLNCCNLGLPWQPLPTSDSFPHS